jgi:Flp pilus assembly protein TadG
MLKKLFLRSRKRTPAQAAVEFALILPVLLVLVYGLLETGRLLFIYSSVISASRNAARYGSADGTSSNGMPYFRDCAGITAAANNLGFLTPLTTTIDYDAGWDSSGNLQLINDTISTDTCQSINWTTIATNKDMQSGDRINVTVTGQYSPIIAISNLIPSFKPLTITGTSSRTLLLSVAINVTPGTAFALTQTQIVKIASYTPTFTATSTNTPPPSPTNTKTATPGTPTSTWTSIPPSATLSPTATPNYTLTPAISCNGKITNTALSYPGNSMTMSITNNTGISVTIGSITVSWNSSAGGSTGGTPVPLTLQSVTLGGISQWSGSYTASTFSVPLPYGSASLVPGTSSIVFSFQQPYVTRPASGLAIAITFFTNGCQNYPINAVYP